MSEAETNRSGNWPLTATDVHLPPHAIEYEVYRDGADDPTFAPQTIDDAARFVIALLLMGVNEITVRRNVSIYDAPAADVAR